jgi:S-(hydroxymethyl)glutathione dehydrogenase/alcohol dehydrogenase
MRAAVFRRPGVPLTLENVSIAPPGPGQVQVRITASGVCHSDLSALSGVFPLPSGPHILGHEGTGIVDSVGDGVEAVRPGDTVVMAMPSCGLCFFCVRGQPSLCEAHPAGGAGLLDGNGEAVATFGGLGTFAERANVSQHSVVALQTNLPPEQLALLGCAVVTGVGAVVRTAQVEPGATVAVVGLGGVGQAVVQGARSAGADRIIAIDPVAGKRDAAVVFGATDVIDPTALDPILQLRELTAGRGVDYVFEAVGSGETASLAWEAARRGGTVVIIGLSDTAASITIPMAQLILSAKHLIGCYFGSAHIRHDLPMLARLAERGRIDLASMVSSTIALDRIDDAFQAMRRGDVIRSVVTFDRS